MSETSWAIVYERPDGWWCAGDCFESEAEATTVGDEHDWRNSEWRVVKTSELEGLLCEEGLEAYEEDCEECDDEEGDS